MIIEVTTTLRCTCIYSHVTRWIFTYRSTGASKVTTGSASRFSVRSRGDLNVQSTAAMDWDGLLEKSEFPRRRLKETCIKMLESRCVEQVLISRQLPETE